MGSAGDTSATGHRGTGRGRTRGLKQTKGRQRAFPGEWAKRKRTVRPPEIFTPVHEECRVYTSKTRSGTTNGDTMETRTHELPLGT